MKATGEVMSIGTSFEQAIMKAVRGAEIGHDCLISPKMADFTDEEIRLHCQLTIQFIDWHRALGFHDRKA